MTTRFMSRASAAFLLFVAAAASGQAQAQNYDGSGALRFGAFFQASEAEFEVERPAIFAGLSDSDTSYGGGVSLGYDWHARQGLILGLEGDASTDDGDAEYLLTFRGRLGTHLQPGWLIYATGGAAVVDIEENDPTLGKVSDTLTGWTAGGGTELDLHHVTLFAEYLHADFDTLDFTVGATRFSVDVDADLFRAGVKFKLGGDGARQPLK
jgi:opacity protein-like surface antigen